MLVLGSALVSGWVFSLSPSHNEQASFDPAGPLSGTDLVHLLVGVGVVAPLYEEKLVRFLMLRGLVSLGPVASTLLVSSLFAIAHEKAMVWSFLASVVFCIAAFRGFTSGQRAVAHGLCNLGILAWHLG
nr:CPBP family glutamic-type intramembrane protease [Lysobacter penaei]